MMSVAFLFVLLRVASCARVMYDGSSTVNIEAINGRTTGDWEVEFVLPTVCSDGSYDIEITVDILGTTPEADLILSIGDTTKYFLAGLGYDIGLMANWDTGAVGSIIVGPPRGSAFMNGDVDSLDLKDWRRGLPEGGNMNLWSVINSDLNSDIGKNLSPLKIKVVSGASSTSVTYTKGSVSNVVVYSDVFTAGSTPSLFLSADTPNDEIFQLTGITTTESCARVAYDGTSAVDMNGADVLSTGKWEIEYPLPAVCSDGTYDIEIVMDIVATSGEADLVIGIGDSSSYFLAGIGYDTGLMANWDNPQTGSLIVAPPSSSSFMSGDVDTLDLKDWRRGLPEGGNMNLWKVVNSDLSSKIGQNLSPFTIDVVSKAGVTVVTYSKGGVKNSVSYPSSFSAGTTPSLFLAPDSDGGALELFTVNSITTSEDCARVKYGGNSTVTLDGSTVYHSGDWEIEYELPPVCSDLSYEAQITIDTLATTAEADLIVAIGDSSEYFVAGIGYDGGLLANWDTAATGSIIVAPPDSSALLSGDVDAMDLRDWRRGVVQGNMNEWSVINSDMTVAIGKNLSPLTIDIISDGQSTTVSYSKGGVTNSVTYPAAFSSTPSIFLAPDSEPSTTELFTLNSITTSVSGCPTSAPTSAPTETDLCREFGLTFSTPIACLCSDVCDNTLWKDSSYLEDFSDVSMDNRRKKKGSATANLCIKSQTCCCAANCPADSLVGTSKRGKKNKKGKGGYEMDEQDTNEVVISQAKDEGGVLSYMQNNINAIYVLVILAAANLIILAWVLSNQLKNQAKASSLSYSTLSEIDPLLVN